MKTPPVKKHLEIKTYTHLDVNVIVQIDYKKGEISLLDEPQYNNGKHWLFVKRGLDYMQGWHNILDAMKYAIDQATDDLQKHVDAEEREKARLFAMVAKG